MAIDLPELDTNQDEPLYQRVRQVIERIIVRPAHASREEPLPPETEIANELGVSRGTVRTAIKALVDEGILERKRGAGTWVRGHRIRTQLEAWYSFSGEMQSRSLPFELMEWETTRTGVPRRAAEALNISIGCRVWVLRRLLGIGNGPTVDFISWFAPRISLSQFDPVTMRLYTYLEKHCGVRPTSSEERITARTADSDEADRLDTEVGNALLVRCRSVSDSDDCPVEYNVGVYRADRFEYTVQLQREPLTPFEGG
jgi:GntR family transcriptional regulator